MSSVIRMGSDNWRLVERAMGPIPMYVLAFFIYQVLPPAFSVLGYHWRGIFFEVIGGLIFIVGVYCGKAFYNTFLPKKKINVNLRDVNYLIGAFLLLIWSIRLILILQYGVIALMHQYAYPSSVMTVVAASLGMPYIFLLLTLLVVKPRLPYFLLFFIEFCFFVVPVMSRSYYLFVAVGVMGSFFVYKGLSYGQIFKRFAPILVAVLLLINAFGPFMHAIRSYAMIGDYAAGFRLKYEDISYDGGGPGFLLDRLNVHKEIFVYEPVADLLVRTDAMAWRSMFEKWIGFRDDYIVHPSVVSSSVGVMVGHASTSSYDIPRNWLLSLYSTPFPLVFFDIIYGFVGGLVFALIFARGSVSFLFLWFSLIFSFVSNVGAVPSTFFFQYILTLLSFFSLFVAYSVLRFIGRLRFV